MKRTTLHDGWAVGPKRGLFDGLSGAAEPTPVRLPHDAMLGMPRSADAPSGAHGAYFAGGAVEYSRTLQLEPDTVNELVFDGVYRDAMVFVNDSFAGQSPGGYSRFAVRLDPFVGDDGFAQVRVEARAHRDSRWYSGLGIHRSVALLSSPLVHVARDGVVVTTPELDDEGALVAVAVTVANDSVRTATPVVTVVLTGPDGAEVGRDRMPVTLLAGEHGVVRSRIWLESPQRWDIDSPTLYRASVEVGADSESVAFGIRSLQLDAKHGLRLNGRTVKLRGACIHHDNGVIGARSIARAEERRVELLRDAGFNAIRSAHNPLSVELLDACDRLGMLVMDESFDMWAESKSPFDYSLAFPEWWERDLESMVAKDVNHPSVVFYSIGNEIPETGRPHGSRMGRLLAEKLHELDPTRFTTNSINGLVSVLRELPPMAGGADVNTAMADMGDVMTELIASDLVTERTEESFAAVDAAGFNYGDSRYASDATAFPNRVMIGTETFPTRIDRNWQLVLDHPHVVGDFTWTGWDYLGEAGIGRVDHLSDAAAFDTSGPYPWQLAWCGDLDITGYRRPVSYFREIVFGLRAEPYIAVTRPTPGVAIAGPWSWTDSIASWTWDAPLGTPLEVEVYTSADAVELLLDGVSLGTAVAERFRAKFVVPWRAGRLEAVTRTGERWALATADGDARLVVVADRAGIRASDDDLAFVAVELHAGEVLDPRVDRLVSVSIDGPGELLGFGSARPDTTESYLSGSATTFEGRALAVIRPTGAGAITVTVTAEGLAPAVVTITAG
ncbi:glycoside hydrolase family 2 TIM barrel-domain containing protein [Schumannella luteola]